MPATLPSKLTGHHVPHLDKRYSKSSTQTEETRVVPSIKIGRDSLKKFKLAVFCPPQP